MAWAGSPSSWVSVVSGSAPGGMIAVPVDSWSLGQCCAAERPFAGFAGAAPFGPFSFLPAAPEVAASNATWISVEISVSGGGSPVWSM